MGDYDNDNALIGFEGDMGDEDTIDIDPNADVFGENEQIDEVTAAEAKVRDENQVANITADDEVAAAVDEDIREITCNSVPAKAEAARNARAICPNPTRVTLPRMTKYERARLIGERALRFQDPRNEPLVPLTDPNRPGYIETDLLKIAEMELLAGRLPMIIRRPLPDGSCEDWKAQELSLAPY